MYVYRHCFSKNITCEMSDLSRVSENLLTPPRSPDMNTSGTEELSKSINDTIILSILFFQRTSLTLWSRTIVIINCNNKRVVLTLSKELFLTWHLQTERSFQLPPFWGYFLWKHSNSLIGRWTSRSRWTNWVWALWPGSGGIVLHARRGY